MRGLTLWQPWSWAIAHAGKRIENRTWPPPSWIVGKQIAIHAGKKLDREAVPDIQDALGTMLPTDFVHGAIEAVATVKGWVGSLRDDHPQRMWLCGPCGWVLVDVEALPTPIPCRGAQKLWTVPSDVVDQIRDQLAILDEGREEPR